MDGQPSSATLDALPIDPATGEPKVFSGVVESAFVQKSKKNNNNNNKTSNKKKGKLLRVNKKKH